MNLVEFFDIIFYLLYIIIIGYVGLISILTADIFYSWVIDLYKEKKNRYEFN